MERRPREVPFAVRAVVVCGVLLVIVVGFGLSLSFSRATKTTPTRADQIIEQDTAITAAMTPRDGTNGNLIQLVRTGRGSTPEAQSLTKSLESEDQAAIAGLTKASWLPESQGYAMDLTTAITAQLGLLRSVGDTAAAVDNTRIGEADGSLWASFHPSP